MVDVLLLTLCMLTLLMSVFSENPLGAHLLWFLGDNFLAKSFRNHFKRKDDDFYVKTHYDFSPYCNSKFASANQNMLARIQNALAAALNAPQNTRLPQYIIVVLDDDLISFLDFAGSGTATLLGSWIQWLVEQFNLLLLARKEQLPAHCNKEVFFYWVCAPTHTCFSKERNHIWVKFNLSLDSVIRTQPNMRLIKIKDRWNAKDNTLVAHDRFTEAGMSAYWRAIDASIKFNICRCEVYLAKKLASERIAAEAIKSEGVTSASSRNVESVPREDPMTDFFRRRRYNDNNA